MLELFSFSFRITAIFLLLAFGIIILIKEKPSFKKRLLLFFFLTTTSYLLAYWEIVLTINPIFQISFFFAVLFPISFWLLSKSLFDDDFIWKRQYLVALIIVSLIQYILYRFNEMYYNTEYANFKFIPYLLSIVFIVLVIFESLRNKDADLVISRSKKRNVFAIFAAFLAIVSLYFFFAGNPWKLPVLFQLIQNIFICVFVILFFSEQFEYKDLFNVSASDQNDKKNKSQQLIQSRIIEKLERVFDQEKLYTSEGMTIAELSNLMNEKEYLIRRAINQELRFTNFNNFLNHYRIKDAKKIIDADKTREKTFQEIAYSLGYQSIATFNRAFKNEVGCTPSEYLSQKED